MTTDAATATRSERGRIVYLAVVASVLTSVATTYGLRALEGAIVGGGTVEVPAVAGLPREAALELVQSRGLRLVVTDREASAEEPAGAVLRQQPLAGSQMPGDGAVEVVVSTGPPAVTLPATLVGQPLPEVRARLEGLGLVIGAVARTGEGAPGAVTALDPPGGTELTVGDRVSITAAPDGIPAPELVGQPFGAARDALEELGLEVGRVGREYAIQKPEDQVLRQDPEPGTLLDEGDPVDLVLAE